MVVTYVQLQGSTDYCNKNNVWYGGEVKVGTLLSQNGVHFSPSVEIGSGVGGELKMGYEIPIKNGSETQWGVGLDLYGVGRGKYDFINKKSPSVFGTISQVNCYQYQAGGGGELIVRTPDLTRSGVFLEMGAGVEGVYRADGYVNKNKYENETTGATGRGYCNPYGEVLLHTGEIGKNTEFIIHAKGSRQGASIGFGVAFH